MATWRVVVTNEAKRHLAAISDQRIREQIKGALQSLHMDPERQGKPLTSELAGYRSLRVVGQCYRILFKIEDEKVIVYVVAVVLRKEGDKADIYEVASKLLKRYTDAQAKHQRPPK